MKGYLHKRKCRHCDETQTRMIYKFNLLDRLRVLIFGNIKRKWISEKNEKT